MDIKIVSKENGDIAIVSSGEVIINDVNDALDLCATISYQYSAYKIIINKENINDDFFDLKTCLAGDILQKYTNYAMGIAIIGDFSVYNSKSLNDFIFECNKGNKIMFKNSVEDAIKDF